PRLLAILLEALERALEVLIVADDDFRQKLFPPFMAALRQSRTEFLKPRKLWGGFGMCQHEASELDQLDQLDE
ncbi:MAG TPA: hypothetical protein VMM18_02170, partial [Gemmatimonadaceae bacterium]|nr:hypothetical protein [Gemmatimonadaceae bacterium]